MLPRLDEVKEMDVLLHPKLVHFPIAFAALMPLLAGGLLLAWWRDWLPRRAWWIAVAVQFLLVGSAFLALESGEVDEEIAEEVVSHDVIHEHEEAAELFLLVGLGEFGLLALAGFLKDEKRAFPFAVVGTALTVAVLGLGIRTGSAGGELVWEHGAANAFLDLPAMADDAGAPDYEDQVEDED